MADDFDDGIDEAFKGFGEDPEQPTVTPPADPVTPPAPAAVEPSKPKEGEEDANKNKPPTNPEGTPPAGDPKPPAAEGDKPADGEEKPGEGKPAEAGTLPVATPPAEPKPLTEDSLRSIINEVRTEERVSAQAVETATQEVLEKYYPQGLSNVLVDQASGKELKSPQDVVDASGGEMTMEEAAQWLINEQYRLDTEVAKIKGDAKAIAETTLKFQQDGVAVLQRYDPVFKMYPQLQQKVWDQYKKLVKADEAKGVILSAPDMADFYDTVLEPYRLAVEYATKNPGTNPTPPATTPPAAAPGAEDRLDEGGDGGSTTEVDDPNDFAQQVKKELAKGL